MSANKGINNSRVWIIAFIATLCLLLSTMLPVEMNGVDITAESEVPALAEGPQLGSSGT